MAPHRQTSDLKTRINLNFGYVRLLQLNSASYNAACVKVSAILMGYFEKYEHVKNSPCYTPHREI